MFPRVKLEAPANNLYSAKVAIKNGADMIYAGIKGWSVRPNIFEMEKEEFEAVIKLVKKHNKEILLVMNCFYGSKELDKALKLIEEMSGKGLSGVIVSQPALAREIKTKFKGLTVHISVQSSASNSKELEFYKSLGIDGVVFARNTIESNPENIQRLSNYGVKIGVFIVGDDIANYDGKCYLSSYLNHKLINDGTERYSCAIGSANKSGYCFLMCKRKCRLLKDGKIQGDGYYLRRQDLALFNKTKELVSSGVSILKIQGREWPVPLVARLVRYMRLALDSLEDEAKYQKAINQLSKLVRIKQQIQANHLWLLSKSKFRIWLALRKHLQRPWDNLETLLWLYAPFFEKMRWRKFQKENLILN
ncbi:MAG: peptidase U32 family protein [Candidatus Omnitrophota bacterium]